MKYYLIDVDPYACSRKTLPKGYDLESPTSQFLLHKDYESLPDLKIEFADLLLSDDALTDVISDSMIGSGFTINEKVKKIFEKFNLGEHRFYKLGKTFDYDTKIELPIEYYRLLLIKERKEKYLEFIDFENSEWVYLDGRTLFKLEKKTIKNLDNYHEYRKKYGIYYSSLVFEKNIVLPDLFLLDEISNGHFNSFLCSKELKEVLINNNITGFRFREANIFYNKELF